ncbi:MAG: hypothetical protein PHT75_02525 [Bacilli bacterium]|nr:hypothetical protein [Bacilli bacterium]MDD4053865.1 hypothetical protein [Bacilli bacterium]
MKNFLKRDSSKLNLLQSEYIRNLIVGYEIKIPVVKEEPKSKKNEYIIENINCLIKVKNRFHYLGYFEDERTIQTKIATLKVLNNTVRKNLPHSKNDKDNVVFHCLYH